MAGLTGLRTALVGGGSGIGRALVDALGDRGAARAVTGTVLMSDAGRRIAGVNSTSSEGT